MASGYLNPGSEAYTAYSPWDQSGMPMLAQMGLDVLAAQFGSPYGQMPFAGHSSYVGVRNQQAFAAAHRLAMQHAGTSDRQGWIELQRAWASARNETWTAESQKQAERVADIAISSYGFASSSPMLMHGIDTMLGGRSALPLAHYVHAAGRHQYDPATGLSAMPGNSAAVLASNLHSRFFGDVRLSDGTIVSGHDSWRSRTRGLTSMELGQLYGQLSSRGMMTGAGDYSGIFDLNTEGGQRAALGDHADRVASRLHERAGAVAAMRELFEGTDAPLPKMLDALEALTGGTQQLTPQRAELLVRTLKAAADGAQITIEGLMMVSQQSEQIAGGLGINRAFGAPMSAAGLVTMQALQRTGATGHGYFGLSDIDSLRVQEQARYGRGVASEFGNAVGALGTLLDTATGPQAEIARQFYDDIKNGRTNTPLFRDFARMRRSEQINWIAANTGLSATEVANQFDAVSVNQERIYGDALGSAIGDAQRVEFGSKFLSRRFANVTGSMLDRVLGGDTGRLNRLVTQAGVTSLMNMDQETRANSSARFGGMAAEMLSTLEAAAAGGDAQAAQLLTQLQGQQGGAAGALTRLAQAQYGQADAAMNGGLADMLTVNSPEVRNERRLAAERLRLSAGQGHAFAGMLEGNWALRLMSEVRKQGANNDKLDWGRMVARALNIQNPSENVTALGSMLQGLEQSMTELDAASRTDLGLLPGESKEQWQARNAAHREQMQIRRRAFEEQALRVQGLIESDPQLKAAYEQLQKEMAPPAGGAEGAIQNAELSANNLTLRINELHINGQVIHDATGTGSANRPGRSTGSVK